MRRELLPSGQVQYFPACEYTEAGEARSLVSGERIDVRPETVVDATYSKVSVPSMKPPAYEVADGAWCVPPNDLTGLERAPAAYVVIGAGKTGMDVCLWLLENGVQPSDIRWVRPRDPWLLDRVNVQPGPEFADGTLGWVAAKREVAAQATSIDDLFERLETEGCLMRLDPEVRPTMYRCATVTRAERD